MSTGLRDMARKLNCNYKTIVRKQKYLARKSRVRQSLRLRIRSEIRDMQFEDLETIEHTKCKPLSITAAVEPKTRFAIGAKVSVIAAKGKLAKFSRKKYGRRTSTRKQMRELLFSEISSQCKVLGTISSDQDPRYPESIEKYFPHSTHQRFKGRKPNSYGHGELKTGRWDKLFWINHFAAMIRDKMKRMGRRSWCATKRADRLQDHLDIFIDYYNSRIIPKAMKSTL